MPPFLEDLVAIFHASFHPTKGNIIDWSQTAHENVDLAGLEFSALPSGLHLVNEDVVHFTSKEGYPGVCIFKRRATTDVGQRGFRLSSLGILLGKSTRPRPWRHVSDLQNLIMILYSQSEDIDLLVDVDQDFWKPARTFFEERKLKSADLSGCGDWNGWSYELDGPDKELSKSNPIGHLPHLLRILGPSSLTLYKHVLGRQRILIYTLPPVQPACLLCQVACDLVFDLIPSSSSSSESIQSFARLPKGKSSGGIQNLGMVTLNDLDKLKAAGATGQGFVACTTDAIFLDKPSYYDLVINLATSTPSKNSRPTLYVSKPSLSTVPEKAPTSKLSVVRFAWSDVRLWNELDRLLALDSTDCHGPSCCSAPACDPSSPSSKAQSKFLATWADGWRVYEDVCLVCASLWMGMGTWKSNSTMSFASGGGGSGTEWGRARQEGDEDFSMNGHYVRTVGMGIEGRKTSASEGDRDHKRRASVSCSLHSSPMTATPSAFPLRGSAIDERHEEEHREELEQRRYKQVLTTLALLQTFHANTCFQLTQLKKLLSSSSTSSSVPPSSPTPVTVASPSSTSDPLLREENQLTVIISAKDMIAFELGPLSSMDARYLGWLVNEYGDGAKLVIRKGWRDVIGVFIGYG